MMTFSKQLDLSKAHGHDDILVRMIKIFGNTVLKTVCNL